MAVPRVFISSTFYDLRHVREDIERFIKDMGYESIRHETGAIPYGKDQSPEVNAYREVELCDIIINVIGGRFGTHSQHEHGYSITQNELKRALDRGIQVFIFVEKNVLSEYSTYQLNKESDTIKYKFVDDKKVYEFIEYLYQLPKNNPIVSFEISSDITKYLKFQWAGLFQRFLQEQKRLSEIKVLDEMKSVSSTLQQLVTFLTEERKDTDTAIKSILMANHPVFNQLAELTNTSYRVYFTNKKELNSWLNARNWKVISEDAYDDDSICEWIKDGKSEYLKISHPIFDENGRLKPFTESEWNNSWLEVKTISDDGDEIPF
jgi:hypothetical protein